MSTTASNEQHNLVERVVARTPQPIARRVRGLSDRAIAWLFIAPSIILLLAINIFPLVWAVRLSFTNYKSNLPFVPLRFVGLANYADILTDEDVWHGMQVTAHFVIWTIVLQVVIGFGLALLINRQFRGHSFWTTVILLPMMLSPAVVGNFWTFLFQPQIGLFNYIVSFFTGIRPILLSDDRRRKAGAVDDRSGRYLDVDALRHADLPGRPALDSRTISTKRRRWTVPRPGVSSARSRCRWCCRSSCWRCCSGRSRTSRCSTW